MVILVNSRPIIIDGIGFIDCVVLSFWFSAFCY